MSNGGQSLASLAGLAYRALNDGDSGYARNKALISQFFRAGAERAGPPAIEHREAVRLTLIDSLYSTQVASRRLYGITDIADALRRDFPDDAALITCAAQWIADGFDTVNPLYGLFAAQYGINKSGESEKGAYSLLSKYLYFATEYSFPIYDALGAEYHYIAGKKTAPDFQRRFRALKEILDENAIDGFDKLDAFFWLYGKVTEGSFSLVLSKARYVDLMRYAQSKPLAVVMEEVRTGQNAAALQEILGAALYEFIRNTQIFDN
jgi:hypothetical protein